MDITIMPLPYVLTEKVEQLLLDVFTHYLPHYRILPPQAVQNWRPIGDGGGWTTEVGSTIETSIVYSDVTCSLSLFSLHCYITLCTI